MMASNAQERRVMIVYDPKGTIRTTSDTQSSPVVHLCHPKTGAAACYLLHGSYLQEIHWFKNNLSSWFVGESVIEDGSLYLSSPVDPLFLIIGPLERARMKKGDHEGNYRTLEDILSVDGFPAYGTLQPLVEDRLKLICSLKELGGEMYFRMDDKRTVAWLCCKVNQTCAALRNHGGRTMASISDLDLKTYAVGMLGEYLSDTWHNRLSSQFGVDLAAAKKQRESSSTDPIVVTPQASLQTQAANAQKRPKTSSLKKGLQPGERKITSFFVQPR